MGEMVESLNDVRPGDLLFTRITKPLAASLLVKGGQLLLGERVRLGPVSVDHVLIVTEAALIVGPTLTTRPRGVQAMPHGAEEIELTPEMHWQPWCAYARLPEDYPGQSADAAAIARAMIGTPYSFASYAMLAAWRYHLRAAWLERRIDRRGEPVKVIGLDVGRGKRGDFMIPGLPREAICSVLADQAWSLAGHRVCEGVARQAVTPGALALQLWRRPGVTWFGPSLL